MVFESPADVSLALASVSRNACYQLMACGGEVTLQVTGQDEFFYGDTSGTVARWDSPEILTIVPVDGGFQLSAAAKLDGEPAVEIRELKLPEIEDVEEQLAAASFIKDVDAIVGNLKSDYPDLDGSDVLQQVLTLAADRRDAIRATK